MIESKADPRFTCTALFAALALAFALPAAAQHEGHQAMEPGQTDAEMMQAHGEATEQGKAAMSPEEAAMMQAWQESMTPGAPHEHLAKAAGEFDFTLRFWMGDPAAEPQVATGTSHREMVMGGRYLVERVESEMMGQEFHGMGTTGFDNTKGTYWSTWFDNMSTGVMVTEGKADDSGKMVMTGDYVDPMTRQAKTSKTVLWWDGADQETLQMFDRRGDDWVKTMEIVYTRRK